MAYNVNPLDVLTEQFRKLPGIGKKSAQHCVSYFAHDGRAGGRVLALN